MQNSVRDAWCTFNRSLEGWVSWMYLDIKALMTTGMGNLIDPMAAGTCTALGGCGGRACTSCGDRRRMAATKANLALAHQGAQAARLVTHLRLADTDITALVLAKLDQNAATLKSYLAFAAFEDWPADAQLGFAVHGMGHGTPGLGRHFHIFRRRSRQETSRPRQATAK